MWQSSAQINERLRNLPEIVPLSTLYSLSVFWRNAIYSEGYVTSEEWDSVLKLSARGKETLEELLPSLEGIDRASVLLAFFCRFCHHDLFLIRGFVSWKKSGRSSSENSSRNGSVCRTDSDAFYMIDSTTLF
jgi:hypothetical protein